NAPMIVLLGREALSRFRLDRLDARLTAAAGFPMALSWVHWLYFVDAEALDAAELDRLCRILQAEPAADDLALDALVVPRLGTLSPWSSKATEIAIGAGLPLRRIERGQGFRWRSEAELSAEVRNAATGVLHDRMTQSCLGSLRDAAPLFHQQPPGEL